MSDIDRSLSTFHSYESRHEWATPPPSSQDLKDLHDSPQATGVDLALG